MISMNLDLFALLSSVKDLITRHNDPNQPEYPQEGLIPAVEGLFQKHGVKPASEDPYGDPADQ